MLTISTGKVLRRFAPALLACLAAPAALAATISGTVFEDANYGGGAGRSLAASGGVGIDGARIEIYNSSGTLLTTITTSTTGTWSYTYTGNAERRIRVVNGTAHSERTGGAGCSTCVPVQTFRVEAPSGSPGRITHELGGRNPALSDATTTNNNGSSPTTTATQTAQSWSVVVPSGNNSTVTGVDFGFNFDTIVNTRDASNCNSTGAMFPCQGS